VTGVARQKPVRSLSATSFGWTKILAPELQAGTASIISQYDCSLLPELDQGITQMRLAEGSINFRRQ